MSTNHHQTPQEITDEIREAHPDWTGRQLAEELARRLEAQREEKDYVN